MPNSPPSFARALRALRQARGLSQEAFDDVSSRTYVSALERGIKAPTLGKVEALAEVCNVHPLTLLALSLSPSWKQSELDELLAGVRSELASLSLSRD